MSTYIDREINALATEDENKPFEIIENMNKINDIILKTVLTIILGSHDTMEVKYIEFKENILTEIIESMQSYLDFLELDNDAFKIEFVDKKYSGIKIKGLPQFVLNI